MFVKIVCQNCLSKLFADLVPSHFNRPWNTLSGEDLFQHQFPSVQWASLGTREVQYFDGWASKCRGYDVQPIPLDSFDHVLTGLWIVKETGLHDCVGLLYATDVDGRDLPVQWLPDEDQAGCIGTVNWHQHGITACRDLNLRCLLVS